MIDRAHVQNGKIIRRLSGEKAWLDLADGSKASPAVIGFESGPDKVVSVEYETQDNSTGPDAVKTVTETVEATRVLILTTIRDKTSEELATEEVAAKNTAEQNINSDKVLKAIVTALYYMARAEVPPTAITSPKAFRQWLRSLM